MALHSERGARGALATSGSSIELRHVSKSFRVRDSDLLAIDDLSLTFERGSFVSLIGPSGCGKSTILRLIADLSAPTSGELLVEGGRPAEARRHRRFGMVFQDATLLPWRDLRGNVMFPVELAKVDRRSHETKADELIALVGLAGYERLMPRELSGGMQQRVAIARALILNPAILLLDEPFGALDEITRHRLNMDLLRIWSESKTTAILVTHSIAEATLLSDRVVVLSSRPAKIKKIIDIDLGRPRRLEMMRDEAFFQATGLVAEALYAE